MADPQKTRWEQMLETEKDKWLGPAWEQLRNEPWVEYVPVNELLPLREYHWSEDYNRHGRDEFLDMIEDMKRHGVREPITIRYFPDTKRAKIIEGNHRLAAAIKAGLKEVPARVTIASYPQSEYGKNSYADNQEGGPVRGRLTDERAYSDYIKPSEIGLTGHKTPTQKLGAKSQFYTEQLNKAQDEITNRELQAHAPAEADPGVHQFNDYLVYFDEKRTPVAYLRFAENQVVQLGVLSPYQRKGIARQLFEAAKKLGATELKGPFTEQGRAFRDAVAAAKAPELKAWLGNSKVKNVVWHGSKAKFDTFQYMPSKRYVLFSEFDVTAHGFFFAPTKEGAAEYGTPRPYYIKLTKPLVTLQEAQRQERFPEKREKQLAYIFEPLLTEYQDYQGNDRKQIEVGVRAWPIDESDYSWVWYAIGSNGIVWDALDNPEVVNRMKSCGYDGTWVDERDMEDGYSIFVVSPNQIKSADQNSGKYDPNDARVTASHKQTPLSDTTFKDVGQGEGTNGYVNQPEKVEGTEVFPSLEELGVKTASVSFDQFKNLLKRPDFFKDFSIEKVPGVGLTNGALALKYKGKDWAYLGFPLEALSGIKDTKFYKWLEQSNDADLESSFDQITKPGEWHDMQAAAGKGQVYLLHFDKPFKMARHYLGWAPDAMERIEQHYQGTGADLTKAMKNEGVTFTVAKIWDNVDENFTDRIRTKGLAESCPFCKTPEDIERDRSKTIEVPEGDTIEITAAAKSKVKAVPMPKVIYDDGFVTPDDKWVEVGDYSTHDDVAARMGFKGPGVEPRQAAINAGYVRVVMWEDQGFLMFRDAADAQRRAGAILRHLPVGLERVGIEAGRGKYTEYELAEAEEKFNSGTLKSASAVTGQVKKIATPHDQETFPDGPVDFFEPVENPHTASEKHPDFLYHGTSRKNRESILKNGLLRSMSEASQVAREMGDNDPDAGGGIFFHTVLLPNDLNRESIDTWKVDVRGIDLERDFTTEHDESDPWWVSWYQDIPPDRLELVSKTGLSRVSFSILETGRKPMSKSAGYTAYVLTEPARTLLLQTFPPKFPDVIAHHVTMQFGVPAGTPPPPPATVVVEGYASDDSLEAVVVSVNGSTTRPDGSTYHITLSLDRSKGRKPVDSNKVIKEQGWKKIDQPFDIQVEPKTL